MAQLIVGILLVLGGALQLWAALATSRRKGPLKTLQARQLEASFGRRGTVVFFAIAGIVLTVAGSWLVSVGMAAVR